MSLRRETVEVAIELARQDMRYRLEVEGVAPVHSMRVLNDYIDSLREHLPPVATAMTKDERGQS